jgi:thimet oligopeptidase
MKNGTYPVPVAVIIDNLAAPREKNSSLMTTYEVWVLFHKTGHAMHHLLTRGPYSSLSGMSVERDFVETPSQAFEKWVYDPQIPDSISGHSANTS